MKEFTPIQKEKIRILIEHSRKDINFGITGTYRKPRSMQIDKKAITQSEAAIKLLEPLIF